MKKLKFNLLIVLFTTINVAAWAQQELTKTFSELYTVNQNSLFEISNKFGNIDIENTNSSTIKINAEIIVKAKNKEKAEKIMNKISVEISNIGNVISAKTEIKDMKISNADFEINYQVEMPTNLDINLTNKYGNVFINTLQGKSSLIVKYGSLNVNKILDDNSKPLTYIDLKYSENSNINELNWGKVNVKYSDLKIGKGRAIAVSSKYSELEIGSFSSIIAESGYDEYNIESVINFVVDSKYSDIKINNLLKKLEVENSYGDLEIKHIPENFSNINILSKYADIDLGIDYKASYKLTAKMNYADIEFKRKDIYNYEKHKESHSYMIKGIFGNTDTKTSVNIESSYGNVSLTN